jgi:hypothetical protein
MTAAAPSGPLTGALRADFRASARASFAGVLTCAAYFARCDTLLNRRQLEQAAGALAAVVADWHAAFGFYPHAPAREFTRSQQRLYAAALGSARDPAAWRDELLEAARGLAAGEGRG